MRQQTNNELEAAKDEALRLLVAYAAAVAKVRDIERGGSARAQRDTPPSLKPNAYSPETLAERWGCSSAHVRNLIKRGELKAFFLGERLARIKASDVEAYERPQSLNKSDL